MRILVAGLTGLLVAGVVAAIAVVWLTGSKELRYPTQAALRGALGARATDELRQRGITLTQGLICKDMPGWTKEKMRAHCLGMTAAKKNVLVIGTGEDKTREHHFTILVDGRPVVENARCLGSDCRAQQD
ncbi:hypothetical protein ACFY4C_37960 [Actinomadura viridis]|uniref:hypothetical protein n=1 Tax=Actinomadura viridis TaxID=58110 RepID=UPI0036B93130